MTPKPETQRWAKSIGIDLTNMRSWRLDVILLTSGELPTSTLPATAPAFSLIVTESMWWATVCRNREEFSYAKWWKGRAQLRGELDFPKPRLASIKKWLSIVEADWGVRFRRDRPFIRSTVKGGAKALVPWLVS